MNKFLTIPAAIAALAIGASTSFAQLQQEGDWYVRDGQGGSKIIVGPAAPQGTPLIVSESATAPANCPAGSFWYQQGYDNQITACGAQTAYDLQPAQSGQMMASGQPYPAGAMVVVPHK